MAKLYRTTLRITPEQKRILEAKTRTAGFHRISEYVRFVLFMNYGIVEKIDAMHKVICEENV